MQKKVWLTIGGLLFSLALLLTCLYGYKSLLPLSIPTSHIPVSGSTTTSATTGQTTVSTNTSATTTTPTTNPTATREFSWTAAQEAELNNMISGFGGQCAVVYQDLKSGYTYTYNADTAFFAASIVKAPYCMYLLDLASQGKCNLNDTIAYTADIRADGTGKVKDSPYGTTFTVQQLIEYAIRYSDNAALRMLRSKYPADGFRDYAKNIGIQNVAALSNITGANINARDSAVFMQAIYTFIETNQTYGPLLRQYMTTTRNPMFTSSYDLIRKYGWSDKSFHDTAIIDAPNPYILVFLTDHEDGTKEDFAMFRTLSKKVEAYSGQAVQ